MRLLAENDELWIWEKDSRLHTTKTQNSKASAESDLEGQRKQRGLAPIREAGLLHRLDFLTSGCLAAAKTERSHQDWASKMKNRGWVKKIYWALVSSEFPGTGSFSLYFRSRYKASKKISVHSTGEENELGECQWRELLRKPHFKLVEVELLGPGKRHQIRAGLAHLHSPLLGDALYGEKERSFFGLHARALELGDLRAECPIPEAWTDFSSDLSSLSP